MTTEELIWSLVNLDTNLDETVGLEINELGQLVEPVNKMEFQIKGLYLDVYENLLVIDYRHKFIDR